MSLSEVESFVCVIISLQFSSKFFCTYLSLNLCGFQRLLLKIGEDENGLCHEFEVVITSYNKVITK